MLVRTGVSEGNLRASANISSNFKLPRSTFCMAANPESFPLLSSGRPTLVAENVEQLLSDPYSVRAGQNLPSRS